MTYIADQITINQNYKNGSWFNTFMDATGMSGFDKGKYEALLQAKILEFIINSGIRVDNDFGRDEFSNEYTMTSESGTVGSSGTKVVGNPNILEDEREIYEQYVKITSSDIATKFQSMEWEEMKRIFALKEQGLVRLNDRMNDLSSKHIGKILRLITMKYLNGFSETYSIYTNGNTTPANGKFSLQTKFLSTLDKNLTFEKLLQIPRMLIEQGKIKESEYNDMKVHLILPDMIFDKLIVETLTKEPTQFNWVVGASSNQPISYYRNGTEFAFKDRINAETIKMECNLTTGISIRRGGKLESYQVWQQNVAETGLGKKTFQCPMWIGTDAFKMSMPTPNAVNELRENNDPNRNIKPYNEYNIHFEERRLSATESRKEFSTNQYRALTRQSFVPLQLENACAFEIDASTIMGISQADLETKINLEYKTQYAETFYKAGHLDENHTFLKPIV